jgi:hypothetical protein
MHDGRDCPVDLWRGPVSSHILHGCESEAEPIMLILNWKPEAKQ